MAILHFIHLSVDGHLGCLQFLDIMNNAAMKILFQGVCVDIYFQGIFLGMELLGHTVVLHLIF